MREAQSGGTNTVVWIVGGWFGSEEWIEEIRSSKESALARVEELWKERRSEKGPDYAQGVCKFEAFEMEVLP